MTIGRGRVRDAARRALLAAAGRVGPQPAPEAAGVEVPDPAASLRRARRRLERGVIRSDERVALSRLVRAYLDAAVEFTDAEERAVSGAFVRLWQPRRQPSPEPPAHVRDAISDQFHRLYYHVSTRTWKDTWYRGIATYKCPTDMWVYQELIDEVRPSLVVETGTFRGGSALFVADRLEVNGHGEVVTIDVDEQPDRPTHPRLSYLNGSSVDPAVLDEVRSRVSDGPVLVILDSDHSQAHVAAELRAYADLITVGSYLIVEDTNVNGHPAAPDHGPGPWEAVQAFLRADPRFQPDPRAERYYLTQNPSGFLRRVAAAPPS